MATCMAACSYSAIVCSSLTCDGRDTSEFAAIMPLAAAAGTPMPGKYESPHPRRPGTGVLARGNDAREALIAGP
jgi:hypothetical protein